MQKAGIISGKKTIFRPQRECHQAEVSTMLHRFIINSVGSLNQDSIPADESVGTLPVTVIIKAAVKAVVVKVAEIEQQRG